MSQNAQKGLDRLKALVEARNSAIEQAQRAQRSAEVGGIIRSLLPERQELQRLQDKVELVRKAIADPVKFGLDARQLQDATFAFEKIARLARTMADDVERFGSTSVAAANRAAEFGLRTATMNPVDRAEAEIRKKFDDDVRSRFLDPNGRSSTSIEAEYEWRSRSTADPFERRRLDAERDRLLQDSRELEGLRRERELRLEELRQRTEQGATRSLRLPENIVEAIRGAESGGRDDARNPLSTATGGGQFIESTWLKLFSDRFAERAAGMSREDILARRTNRADTDALIEAPRDVLARMCATCDGQLVLGPTGLIGIRGGRYKAPLVNIPSAAIRQASLAQGNDRLDTYNRLKVSYSDPDAYYQPTELRAVEDTASQAQIGVVDEAFDLAMVPSWTQAARLAKIKFAKDHPAWKGTLATDLTALDALGEDAAQITFDPLGDLDLGPMMDEPCTITAFGLRGDMSGCDVAFAAISADAYAWDPATEEPPRPALPTYVPPLNEVPIPTGVNVSQSLRSGQPNTAGGDLGFRYTANGAGLSLGANAQSPQGRSCRIALSYGAGADLFRRIVNGDAALAASPAALPSGLNVLRLGVNEAGTGQQGNMILRRFAFIPSVIPAYLAQTYVAA